MQKIILICCKKCQGVFNATSFKKKCDCGETSGKIKDEKAVLYGEYALSLQFNGNAIFPFDDVQTIKEEKKQYPDICIRVISYLNYIAGSDFKTKYPSSHSRLIEDRIRDGYDEHDFLIVIDKMYESWKGTTYEMYLRPSTLFNKTKFENYLGSLKPPTNEDGANRQKNTASNQFSDLIAANKAAKNGTVRGDSQNDLWQ